jgi:hypothetical protein
MMEMYADAESRGGVLEPEGTIEIKFRKEELVRLTLRRIDSSPWEGGARGGKHWVV